MYFDFLCKFIQVIQKVLDSNSDFQFTLGHQDKIRAKCKDKYKKLVWKEKIQPNILAWSNDLDKEEVATFIVNGLYNCVLS